MSGEVIQLTTQEATMFLMKFHYSGRMPTISKAFGWLIDGQVKAVCTFGKPASPFVCKGLCGEKWSKNVYELNRLARLPEFHSYPLSQFVSACLRNLKDNDWIVVSYSDTAMSHHGYIYQASNFVYTGCTPPRTDIWSGTHARHYTQADRATGVRVLRSAKHRYVYFCTRSKYLKTEWRKDLKYPVLPYPKGDNAPDYSPGTVLQPTLIQNMEGK